MTFTLPSPRKRFLVCLCCGLLAALLCYFAARNAMAAHFQEEDTRAGYERAVRLEPSDSRSWYLLGRSYLYDLEQPDPARASRDKRALSCQSGHGFHLKMPTRLPAGALSLELLMKK